MIFIYDILIFLIECLFNFLLFYNYFILGCAGSLSLHGLSPAAAGRDLLSSCSAWASHCGASHCGAQASGVAAHGLNRLSSFKACGIFPEQGPKPKLLH